MGKRGPKLTEAGRRDFVVAVRLSESELCALDGRAELSGLGRSDYIRECLLRMPATDHADEDKK